MFKVGDIVAYTGWLLHGYTFQITRYVKDGYSDGIIMFTNGSTPRQDSFKINKAAGWIVISKQEVKSHLPDYL